MPGDVLTTLGWTLLPLIGCWIAISGVVAAVAVRVSGAEKNEEDRLEPEMALAVAGSGAAAGGFLGLGSSIPGRLESAADFTLGHSLLAAGGGMLLGAVGAVWLALLVLSLRDGRG